MPSLRRDLQGALAVAVVASLYLLLPAAEPAHDRFPPGAVPSVLPTPSLLPRPTPTRLPLPRVVKRVQTTDRVVFVTIDDGWWRDWRVVRLARRTGFPMTGFVLERAARDRALPYYRALSAAGVRIENHSRLHPVMPRLSYLDQKREICGSSGAFARRFGRRPTIFRPPYGLFDLGTRTVAAACGIRTILLWTVEVIDRRIIYARGDRLRTGDVVLLHFTPHLRDDLAVLRRAMKRDRVRAARLGDYIR